MIYAAAIAAAVALIGQLISAGQEAQAQAVRQGIADKFGAQALPHLDQVVAQQLPPDSVARYQQVTQAKTSQSDALRQLGQIVDAHGETVDDKAAYLRSANATAGQQAASRSAVLRTMATRGLAGSGVEAAVEGQGNQAALNQGAQANLDEASAARQRQLTAISQLGSLSSTARGQDTDALKAQDAINMFNANARRDAANQNNQIAQTGFENSMGKLSAQANALNGVAGGYDRASQNTLATAGGIGAAAITAGTTYDQYGNPVPTKKPPVDWGTS